MEEPSYHLSGVVKTRDELPADFDSPLDVILLLLSSIWPTSTSASGWIWRLPANLLPWPLT